MITVLETTKTGLHDVWPFYPEWVEQFRLRTLLLPDINTDLGQTTLQRIGQQVSTQFKALPGALFSLRFAPRLGSAHYPLRLARYRCCPHDGALRRDS